MENYSDLRNRIDEQIAERKEFIQALSDMYKDNSTSVIEEPSQEQLELEAKRIEDYKRTYPYSFEPRKSVRIF
ncbi:hypothetical protein ACQ5SI_02365 [Peribacillus frigoritolerans]|uniref:hypothetical protein n=1 Tax=Peribacillus frigoritolerans TaxID=450367 RepID=UPI003D342CEA